ncbi:MAG: TolC family protein, partial [Pseudogulbenkiania sp.]|nr:TolC family protein [Pseudogulbenkiania sp.]
ESLSTLNQRNRYSTIGVQINIPVFSGGYISAQSRQAAANREKAREELNAARAKVMSNTTREFNNVQSGEARVRALETAVISSERALRSARMGFQAGTSTNVDILNAEEKRFTARHDLLEAKLRYLMAQLRLRSAVGTLGDQDMEQVNNYLGPELPL